MLGLVVMCWCYECGCNCLIVYSFKLSFRGILSCLRSYNLDMISGYSFIVEKFSGQAKQRGVLVSTAISLLSHVDSNRRILLWYPTGPIRM